MSSVVVICALKMMLEERASLFRVGDVWLLYFGVLGVSTDF